MAEVNETIGTSLKLDGVFAFKEGMSSYIDDKGDMFAVTVLRVDPWVVTQIKTEEKDGYTAVQVSSGTRKGKNARASDVSRTKAAGFENGARWSREMRQDLPDGVAVGQKLDLASLAVGDEVKVSSRSKGKGFAGAMKRWNLAGGRATHGSGFHRAPGSVGNRTWPGRVMPGKKFPGHLGDETTTVRSVVVDVIPEQNTIFLRGPVPGGKNTLVKITKV
jgi:large subunit ribosomal protein L3